MPVLAIPKTTQFYVYYTMHSFQSHHETSRYENRFANSCFSASMLSAASFCFIKVQRKKANFYLLT